jgi:alkane 1-monooxygenase
LPLIYGLIICYFYVLSNGQFEKSELVGMTLSVGIVLGSGINVAHELGHKSGLLEQTIAKLILLPNLYMHFIIEHNHGHHVHIATPDDPATSRKGEMVYAFWVRSSLFSYLGAWKLEAKRLTRAGKFVLSLNNQMIIFQTVQLIYLLVVWAVFGAKILLFAIAIAIIGFLLLETINYIEHYGLVRAKLANGKYERVDTRHSWNSNHELGRIILYELTRHSDHHFKANRKYQILRHHSKSPQLPLGYPGSMLLSFIPPLWFFVMHKKLETLSYNSIQQSTP